jgi:hypothetical protein
MIECVGGWLIGKKLPESSKTGGSRVGIDSAKLMRGAMDDALRSQAQLLVNPANWYGGIPERGDQCTFSEKWHCFDPVDSERSGAS